jgi:hypothetical protein
MKTAPTVKIDPALLERLQAYRLATGIPVVRSVNDAIKDFLEICVPARLEALGLPGLPGISQDEKKLTSLRKKAS